MTSSHDDPACEVAHGTADEIAHGTAEAPTVTGRVLVAVFASPVARFLLRYGRDAGYRPVLVEPDPERAKAVLDAGLDADVQESVRSQPDGPADVVVADHHRPELGLVLRDALDSDARWIGVMGNPRVPAPHVPADTVIGWAPSGTGVRSSHAAQLHLLLDAMDAKRRPPMSGAQGRETLELVTGLYRSAFTGQPVLRDQLGPDDAFYHHLHGNAPGWAS